MKRLLFARVLLASLALSVAAIGHAGCDRSTQPAGGRPAGQVASARSSLPLYAFRGGQGKCGFVDATGHIRIAPRFDTAYDFSEGVAAALFEGKWGFIDPSGVFALQPTWDWTCGFSEGLAAVNVGGTIKHNDLVGGRWGYIDLSGRMIIPPQFREAGDFYDGVALATLENGAQGVIDRRGKWVVPPPIITNSLSFSEGLLPILMGDKGYAYIDPTGVVVIEPQFGFGYDFSEGLAGVRVSPEPGHEGEPDHGYIDRSGRIVIPPRFSNGRPFSEGLAAVNIGGHWEFLGPTGFYGGRWGYIDRSGKSVIEPRFEWAGQFSEGLAAVRVTASEGGKVGFIDRTGKFVIPPQFEYVRGGFRGGVARVSDGSRYLLVSPTGEVVFSETDKEPWVR